MSEKTTKLIQLIEKIENSSELVSRRNEMHRKLSRIPDEMFWRRCSI